VGRQFRIHAGATVIFHFSVNRVIATLTGKKRADNRLVRYMTVAVSFFHMPPPFQKSLAGANRSTAFPKGLGPARLRLWGFMAHPNPNEDKIASI
jgi:hypothetical protein